MNCISSFSRLLFFPLGRFFSRRVSTKCFYRDTFYYNEPTQIIFLWSQTRINDQKWFSLCNIYHFIKNSVIKIYLLHKNVSRLYAYGVHAHARTNQPQLENKLRKIF